MAVTVLEQVEDYLVGFAKFHDALTAPMWVATHDSTPIDPAFDQALADSLDRAARGRGAMQPPTPPTHPHIGAGRLLGSA